jgi:glycosyltransferase involved in cell wall biosynthesis
MAEVRGIPSFSVVLETENLSNADLTGLSHSLASLTDQDLPLTEAREVLVIDSGDIPAELIVQLQEKYPWLTIHPADSTIGYYEAKMLGVELATGEIIVFCDSDCVYEPHWLRTLLTSFQQFPGVDVVAGETSTRRGGAYGIAMGLTYIFPPYSNQTALAPTGQYFLNNVAFRRQFLLQYPMPCQLPLYRGNCLIHAHHLCQQGFQIWRQPQSRGTHAPPNGLSHFYWRFLLIGHDYYWQKLLLNDPDDAGKHRDPVSGVSQSSLIFWQRLQFALTDNPYGWLLLLPALPITLAGISLIAIGYLCTLISPHFLLRAYNQLLLPSQQPVSFHPQVSTSPVNPLSKSTRYPDGKTKQISQR